MAEHHAQTALLSTVDITFWAQTIERLGLTPRCEHGAVHWHGLHEGQEIRMVITPVEDMLSTATIILPGEWPMSAFSAALGMDHPSKVVLGDPAFDDGVVCIPYKRLAYGLLDADTRTSMVELLGLGITIGPTDITLPTFAAAKIASGVDLVAAINRMVTLAARLGRNLQEPAKALLDIAKNDPSAGVRHRYLELVSLLASDPELGPVIQLDRVTHWSDTSDDGMDALWRYAARGLTAEVRDSALKRLFDLFEPSHLMARLERERDPTGRSVAQRFFDAMQERGTSHAEALTLLAPFGPGLYDVLGGFGHDEVKALFPELLAEVLEQRPDNSAKLLLAAYHHLPFRGAQVTRDLIVALGDLADPGATPFLTKQLEHSMPEMVVTAIQALAQTGTSDAIRPLTPLTKGFFIATEIKEAARDAIVDIKEREGDVAPAVTGESSQPMTRNPLSLVVGAQDGDGEEE